MKLATLNIGTRSGALAVVSRDLSTAVLVRDTTVGIKTLQAALDDWSTFGPRLAEIAQRLDEADVLGLPMPYQPHTFDPRTALAPLPRAYQWADGSAYVNHVELVRKARGAEMPASFWTEPLMYQGGSDTLLGAHDDIVVRDDAFGIDLEGEIAVVTGDVPMGISAADAGAFVRLIMLANDVSLRNLIPGELAKGFGFFQSKPSTAFAPVAVTPESLGDVWREGKLHLPVEATVNGVALGRPNAGVDMTFSFHDLIAHAAKTRKLSAGTIIGSGTVSNKSVDGGPGKSIADGGLGYTCLAELRTIETIRHGKPATPFLTFGDRVTLDVQDANGQSVFGCIDQKVVKYAGL
jgi:fumarylacetoacetate (FAA) hydrolase